MILGFGKIEDTTARDILKKCCKAISDNPNIPPIDSIETIRDIYNKQYNEYGSKNASEVPERYSCFWAYQSGEYFRFQFHHINRRHPFSKDGWAMIQSTWLLNTITGEIFKEA